MPTPTLTAPPPEPCPLSDLPADQCGCRLHRPDGGTVAVEPASVRSYGYQLNTVIEARYPGTCQECGDRYEVGESITPQRHGGGRVTGRWAHEECAKEA